MEDIFVSAAWRPFQSEIHIVSLLPRQPLFPVQVYASAEFRQRCRRQPRWVLLPGKELGDERAFLTGVFRRGDAR